MEITKTTRLLFPFILSFSLIACGGSGFSSEGTTTTTDTSSNPNTDDGTTDTASKAATLEISASSAQLQSDGSIPVTISAIVKDQGNIILSDIDVAVTVDGNASVTPTTGTSIRTAQVLPGLNHPENRKLTVTVSTLDGSNLSETLEVDVSGTEVQIDGPENISLNTATDFIIKLTDSSGKGLSNQTVVIESSNTQINPVNSSGSFVTDINGELKVSVEAAQGGTDTISISALGASTTKTITLSGEAFVLVSDNTEVDINTDELITVTLTDNNGDPIGDADINFEATRGVLAIPDDSSTDENGHIAFSISSPTAGNTIITATAVNSGLTATLVREFVAVTPASIITQAEPVLIAPLNSSSISAKVLDVNNNPVKNQKVIFNLNDTVNGSLSSSSAITNSSGRATIVYTAGDTTSAFEGVQINNYVDGFASSINDNIGLTVGGEALRLIMGTNNEVGTNSTTTYAVNYGVIVTDSSGNPVKDKTVEFTVTPVSFYKGELDNSGEKWSNTSIECEAEDRNYNGILDTVNEDTNNNGVLDPGEDSNVNGILDINEDLNGNGLLEPSNTAAINSGGEAKTDINGLAEIKVIYLKDQAKWSKVELKASVVVNGTESYQTTQFILPIPASEYSNTDVLPSNAHGSYLTEVYGSPYGIDAASSADCASPL